MKHGKILFNMYSTIYMYSAAALTGCCWHGNGIATNTQIWLQIQICTNSWQVFNFVYCCRLLYIFNRIQKAEFDVRMMYSDDSILLYCTLMTLTGLYFFIFTFQSMTKSHEGPFLWISCTHWKMLKNALDI